MVQAGQNAERGQMNQAEAVVEFAFVADDQAAKVLEPGEQTLDRPVRLVAAQWAAILHSQLAISAVGRDQLNQLRRHTGVRRASAVRR